MFKLMLLFSDFCVRTIVFWQWFYIVDMVILLDEMTKSIPWYIYKAISLMQSKYQEHIYIQTLYPIMIENNELNVTLFLALIFILVSVSILSHFSIRYFIFIFQSTYIMINILISIDIDNSRKFTLVHGIYQHNYWLYYLRVVNLHWCVEFIKIIIGYSILSESHKFTLSSFCIHCL